MARLFLPTSMAENFSRRGHETRTYVCACYIGFKINKFIINERIQAYNHSIKNFGRKYTYIS